MRRKSTSTRLTEKARNAERMLEAARMKRCGLTLQEIGAKLGCSRQRAQVIVQQGIDAFREGARRETSKWVEEALVKLEQAEQECWVEWQRSKQDRQRRTVKTIAAKPGKAGKKTGTKAGRRPKTTEATDVVEGQCADAAYIGAITNCIDECAKLLGVCKPANINMTQQAGVTVEHPEETKLRGQLATMLGSMYPPPPSEKSPGP
jgi:hypothetical protein